MQESFTRLAQSAWPLESSVLMRRRPSTNVLANLLAISTVHGLLLHCRNLLGQRAGAWFLHLAQPLSILELTGGQLCGPSRPFNLYQRFNGTGQYRGGHSQKQYVFVVFDIQHAFE